MKPNIQNQLRVDSVVQARQTIERRVNELGVAEPQIAEQGRTATRSSCSCPASPTSSMRRKSSGHGLLELKIVEGGLPPTAKT
jgi:preprotein translocase subunit SecD